MINGTRAFCRPRNQPTSAKFANVAGALQIPNRKILIGETCDGRIGADEADGGCTDGYLQQQQEPGDRERDNKGLTQGDPQPVKIVGTILLCGDAGCTHAQEINARVQKSEDG